MKAVVQRVTQASVTVNDTISGAIESGLLVYLGVYEDDVEKDLAYIIRKLIGLRIFTDDEGKMNLSVQDTGGSILLVSQFTLCAVTTKGNRPSFNLAAVPDSAEVIYEEAAHALKAHGLHVETGVFGAHMRVSYTNEGPVTIILDSKDIKK